MVSQTKVSSHSDDLFMDEKYCYGGQCHFNKNLVHIVKNILMLNN